MTILTDAQIAGLAAGAGFPPSEIPHAVAIALAESGGKTDAVGHNLNGTTDTGVWQINSVHAIQGSVLVDPVANAKAAHDIWVAAGNSWRPWTTFITGAYLVFMGRGNAAAAHPDSSVKSTTVSAGQVGSVASGKATIDLITSGSLWLRIGAGILGVILLVMGVLRLMGSNKTVIQFAKDAATAAAVA